MIRRAVGCSEAEWRRSWPKVSRYWRLDGNRLVNDTQLEVYAQALAIRDRASKRGRAGGLARGARAQAGAQAQPELRSSSTQAEHNGVLESKPLSLSLTPKRSRSGSDGNRAAKRREPDENEAAGTAAIIEHLVAEMQAATGEVERRTKEYRDIALSLPEADVHELLSELKESLKSPDRARNAGAILFANAKKKATARGVSLFGPTTQQGHGAVQ
jgi:hypothetical protein